jgi:hypothetical protein
MRCAVADDHAKVRGGAVKETTSGERSRGGFRWAALRPGLLRALREDLHLRKGRPDEVLESAVGLPDDDFVKRAWPVLRDRWLATDRATRRSVVEALREEGLGDTTLRVGTSAADVDYLRSCNNGKTLREVVLAHLLAAGAAHPEPVAPKSPAAPAGTASASASAHDLAEHEWSRFARALAITLAQLEVDQFLVLEARRHAGYYVQFAQGGPAGLRAEAVSNLHLEDYEQLDEEAEAQLAELGWQPPEPAHEGKPEGPPNWYRAWELPVPYEKAAELAAATLRSVYEVSAPAYLAYNAFHRSGAKIILPNLGIVRCEPLPTTEPAPRPTESLTPEATLEKVMKLLAEKLQVESVFVDADGDVPISTSGAQFFIRVHKDAPIVGVFGALAWGFGNPPGVESMVNEINRDIRFARAYFDGKGVLLATEVLIQHFDPEDLWDRLLAMIGIAQIHAPRLQERFGGQIPFGPALPPKKQMTGGYL